MGNWTRTLPIAALLVAAASPSDQREADRRLMVLGIENIAATAGVPGVRTLDAAVLRQMRRVPRHLFVPQAVRAEAYSDRPLPIGHGATISQPYIVALMTDQLKVRPHHKVLEVGTGSGYQAAVLAGLVDRVFTVEIVPELAAASAAQLRALGYANVEVRAGDGYLGWPEQAPFDRIIVTAGATEVPQPLVDQLRPGGRMVIPVGRTEEQLQLSIVTKDRSGRVRTRKLLPVRFVPLVRASG